MPGEAPTRVQRFSMAGLGVKWGHGLGWAEGLAWQGLGPIRWVGHAEHTGGSQHSGAWSLLQVRQKQEGTEIFFTQRWLFCQNKAEQKICRFFYRNLTFSLADKISLSGLLFFNPNNLKHFRNVLRSPAPDAYQHLHASSPGPRPLLSTASHCAGVRAQQTSWCPDSSCTPDATAVCCSWREQDTSLGSPLLPT